jgi:hypothetical protein
LGTAKLVGIVIKGWSFFARLEESLKFATQLL